VRGPGGEGWWSSGSREPLDDRRERLHVPLEDGEIRDPVPLAPLPQNVADLLDGAEEHVGRLEDDLERHLEPVRQLIGGDRPLPADRDGLDERVKIERVEARTGGGGRHIYFAHDGAARDIRNRTAVAPGVDARAEGGYVVAPPSIHPNGRRYRWTEGRVPGEAAMAPLPPWLADLLGGPTPPGAGHPLAHWRRLVRDGVAEGERNNTIASFAGHLLWHGVDPDVALELLLCWNAERCRPPLSEDEVAGTVASIVRTRERHRDSVEE